MFSIKFGALRMVYCALVRIYGDEDDFGGVLFFMGKGFWEVNWGGLKFDFLVRVFCFIVVGFVE